MVAQTRLMAVERMGNGQIIRHYVIVCQFCGMMRLVRKRRGKIFGLRNWKDEIVLI